ncbi:putative eka-like protein [Erysiphe necator]|uniref:Putative eka-like protein n=1 Tax=Uncinula necator TaxID=52586 RepID=A0A0B1PDP6_UNCNE|nr:putative eka-like protein [Erysiphe necator]
MIIPTVLSSIRKAQGRKEVSSSMLIDEVERVCALRPAYVKIYGEKKAESPHKNWMAYFLKAPRAGYRVFNESGIARPFKKNSHQSFENVVMVFILPKTAQEHLPEETLGRITTLKTFAWLELDANIVEVHTVWIVADVLLALLA